MMHGPLSPRTAETKRHRFLEGQVAPDRHFRKPSTVTSNSYWPLLPGLQRHNGLNAAKGGPVWAPAMGYARICKSYQELSFRLLFGPKQFNEHKDVLK